jgi:hypothetical protein
MIAGFFDTSLNKSLTLLASIITIVGSVYYMSPSGQESSKPPYVRPQPPPETLCLQRIFNARHLVLKLRNEVDRERVSEDFFLGKWVAEEGWYCFLKSWPTPDETRTSGTRTWSIDVTEASLHWETYSLPMGGGYEKKYWYTTEEGGVRILLRNVVHHMNRQPGDLVTVWGKVIEIGDVDGTGYVVLDSARIDTGFVGNKLPVKN